MKYKNFLSKLLCLSLLLSVVPMKFTMAQEYQVFEDFNNSAYITGKCVRHSETNDSRFEKALEVYPTSEKSNTTKDISLTAFKTFWVSFDFKAKENDHIYRMVWANQSNATFASIYWDQGGRVVFSKNAKEPTDKLDGKSNYADSALTNYDTSWHNISAKVVSVESGLEINYYYDGAFVTKATADSTTKVTNELNTLKFILASTVDGYNIKSDCELNFTENDGLYIDNLKVFYDTESFYATSEKIGDYVKVDFSEPCDVESIKDEIVVSSTVTGEELEIDNIEALGNSLYLEIPSQVDSNTEYAIKFPNDFISSVGNPLEESYVYFVSDVKSLSWNEVEPALCNYDFEDLAVGSADSKWSTVLNTNSKYIKGLSCVDLGGNKAIQFEGKSDADQVRFSSDTSRWTVDKSENKLIVSVDVRLPEIKRTPDFLVRFGSFTMGQWFFDSYGNFVMLSETMSSSEDKEEGYSANHIVYELGAEADTWYTVKMCIDKLSKAITYYINDEYAGKALFYSGVEDVSNLAFGELRIKANTDIPTNDGRKLLLDNLKISYVESDEGVSSVRFDDEYAPGRNDIPSTIKKGYIKFSKSIKAESAVDSAIEITSGIDSISISITDVTEDSISFDILDSLKRDTEYKISVSDILLSTEAKAKDYEAIFKTSKEGSLVVKSLGIYNENGKVSSVSNVNVGENIYAKAYAQNTTDDDIDVTTILNIFKNNALYKSLSKTETLEAGDSVEILTPTFNVDDKSGLDLTAFVIDENNKPLCASLDMLSTSTITPDEWTIDYSTDISGEGMAFVEVFLPDKSASDLDDDTLYDVLAYRGVLDYNKNINAKFKLFRDTNENIEPKSGKYSVNIVTKKGKVINDSFEFINDNDAVMLLDVLQKAYQSQDKASSVSSIKNALKEYKYGVIQNYDRVNELNLEKIATICYNTLNESTSPVTTDEAKAIATSSTVIEAVTEGKCDNLFAYPELKLDNSEIKDFYDDDFVSGAMQTKITSDLKGISFDSLNAFHLALIEPFVLRTVEDADGIDNAKAVISAFCDEIGLSSADVAKLKDAGYRLIINKKYNDYAALKQAIKSQLDKQNSQNSSSGGSSGGSSSKSKIGTVSLPTISEADKSSEPLPYHIFDDIDSVDWAKNAIEKMAEKGIINGKGDNKFGPNDYITREELAKIIVNAFFTNEDGADIKFTDVEPTSWSYDYVRKAYALGIVSGYSDTLFGAKDNVTRQDLAVMVYRAAVAREIQLSAKKDSTFSDEASFAPYATEAINTLYKAGIINGVDSVNFDPNSFATRAQVAKIIYSLL